MKLYVAGSLATSEDLRRLMEVQDVLKKAGFEVLNPLVFNYTRILDFRGKVDMAKWVADRDLTMLKEADVVVALGDKPSFGAAMETFYAKRVLNKRVILIASKPTRSPWMVAMADIILDGLSRLVDEIRKLTTETK